jgi:hypothetical protein
VSEGQTQRLAGRIHGAGEGRTVAVESRRQVSKVSKGSEGGGDTAYVAETDRQERVEDLLSST